MGNYCVLGADGIVTNIIVCNDDATAAKFGAVPSYEGADIGAVYAPPEPEPAPGPKAPITWDTLAEAIREGVNEV
nr:hypothetical protein [uncultured Oscillibacter sp.]